MGELLRNGMRTAAGGRRFGLEQLMARFGVDVYLCGHEHNYERLWPVLCLFLAPLRRMPTADAEGRDRIGG